MTARQKRIWNLLEEHDCLTSQQIAALLHISDRTVRNDIKEINLEQHQEAIASKKGQGYSIRAGWEQTSDPMEEQKLSESNTEWEIVRRILFEPDPCYLELADELFISDTLLTKIVARLNRNMTRRHGQPSVVKRNGRLTLSATEEEKRSYYTLYIMDRNVDHYFEPERFQPFFEIADLPQLKEQIFEKLHPLRHHLHDTTIIRLLIGTAVMIERTVCGFLIPDSGANQNNGSVLPSEGLLFLKELEQEMEFSLPASEHRYFSRLFQNDFYYVAQYSDSQAAELLEKILIEINVEYGFDFTADPAFCHEMTEQLHGAIQRSRHGQSVINPVLSRIKSKYPLEYDIAIFFADRFNKLSNSRLSEDEVSFLAIHFIKAMETSLGRSQQKVALINPYGKQIKELMVKRLEEIGECRFKIAYTWSVFDYPKEMPKDILAILTTIPLPGLPEDIPVILCRNFLDYREKEKLLTTAKEHEVKGIRSYFRSLFKPSLFFTGLDFDSRQDALAFLCRQLNEQGYVEPDFYDSVMQREAIAPTAFEPGFALAHGMENTARQTAVCVCILKNKLPWGEHNVKIIFLFALASSWNHTMIPIYNVLIDNLLKTNTIYRLAKVTDCQEFMDLII